MGNANAAVTELGLIEIQPSSPITDEPALDWLERVQVGYDNGFVIASSRALELDTARSPYLLKINGWGQLRHTVSDFSLPEDDLNQLQLKRGRLVFSGNAFNPNFSYFMQLDGRSTDGDDIRLLDYYIDYDLGNDQLELEPGTIAFRAGKYKMPFTMSRWLSGRDFEFADRSMSSIFFDVDRSFAVGLHGTAKQWAVPIHWDVALFNGIATGGAATGNRGGLDDNFAYSGRVHAHPIGDWGKSKLADLEHHDRLAMRVGGGFARSTIERSGNTEFNRLRVVDSGAAFANVAPATVSGYDVSLYAVDASFKYRGWSSTLEYYFRNLGDIRGAAIPELLDHGFWFQLGKFVVPGKLELITRWSRVQGDSGTLGLGDQSSEEVAGAVAWYFRENHAKLVVDATHLNGATLRSQSLDIEAGNRGWLFRSQIQFSF
ncbi:Phosphate-selective porin O and P [Novipirellula galeiformis]|uniref:Phosphate-selective porin O and P n=1 Tax=Novipirellula galeiformis TaxID=2528004 RepID=A0A5C6CSX6_9BACT|nr:porin [Novipirellula galeiformis]TWU26531.1 Phosphate-selective porin O and P [Novipirellula galeiformis]